MLQLVQSLRDSETGAFDSKINCFNSLQDAPKIKVAIVGGGLAGLSTAVELLDQGHEVDIYESRPFIGGKVASFKDKDGNHIEVSCD